MNQLYKKIAKHLWLSLAVCLTTLTAFSQSRLVTGRVTDATGGVIPSATVMIKGTKTGTSTDVQGNYSIAAKTGDVLVVRFTGFLTRELTVGSASRIDVKLEEDQTQLEDVVVVGYGTQKRSKITGSVSKLDHKVIETGVRANPASALAGTIPGLRVQQTSGRPGAVPSIILRGGTNLDGSGSPLVVVDGFLRSGFSDINQDDIESIEVLKDASATAIYGARANNGVVLITTKKGKNGVSEISLRAKTGINKINNPYEFLNARDYLYWSRMSIKTSGMYDPSRLSQLTSSGPFGTGNRFKDGAGNLLDGNKDASAVWSTMILNDDNRVKLADGWQTMKDPVYGDELIFNDFKYSDYALRDYSLTQDYNVSVNGGNDKGKYYAGLGSFDEQGLPINSYYKRITFVLNAEYKLKPWLTSISSFNFADAKWRDAVSTSEGFYMTRSLGAPPTMRGVNEKGDLLIGRDSGDGNPLVNADKYIRRNNTDKFTLSQAFQVDFMKGLNMRVSANWFFNEGHYESFNKDYLQSPGVINTTRSSSASFSRDLSQTYNAVVNYNTIFAERHNVQLMAGSEYYDIYSKGLSASGSGAPTDDFMDLGLTNSDKDRRSIDSFHNRQRILSFFSRFNYDFDEKYLFQFTVRRDGYSTLINNRFGTFPGVSVGWNIHKEDFMQPISNVVNSLKLKAGYGENGNVSSIGAYTLQGSYGTNKYNSAVGYLLSGLPFPDLLWERSSTVEVGLEATLLNKVDVTVSTYQRKTSDKISSFNLPATAGYTSLTTNNGSIQNKGVEADVNYRAVNGRDWTVSVSANVAYNANKILKLPANGLENNRQGGIQVYDPRAGKIVFVGGYQEGQDPSTAYAYVAEDLYRTQADLDKYAANLVDLNGAKILLGSNKWNNLTPAQRNSYYQIAMGDVRWKDIDQNDTIDYRDRARMGRTIPRWTGGFSVNVKYKRLSLSTRLDYALGFVQFDGPRAWFLGNSQGTFNTTSEVFDSYTPENINAKYPTYYWADQLFKANVTRESSMFYKKGDYLALREVSLSYSLPTKWADKIRSQGVNFTLTGQNLAYLSESTLFSPESGSLSVGSAGSGGYPLPRTFIFGVQFIF